MDSFEMQTAIGHAIQKLVVRVIVPRKCPSLNLLFGGKLKDRLVEKNACKEAMNSASFVTANEIMTQTICAQKFSSTPSSSKDTSPTTAASTSGE